MGNHITAISTTLALSLAILASCQPSTKSGKGFQLPDGDADKGKAAFLELKCNQCHSVSGVELPAYQGEAPYEFNLGGEVPHVTTYGQLVTAVINPEHKLSEKYRKDLKKTGEDTEESSPMPSFNETMTVSQMIDIVAFLHPRYKKSYPEYSHYEYYP